MMIEAGIQSGISFRLPRAADECIDHEGIVRAPYADLLAMLERAAGALPSPRATRSDGSLIGRSRSASPPRASRRSSPSTRCPASSQPVSGALSRARFPSARWRLTSSSPTAMAHSARSEQAWCRAGSSIQQHRLPPGHRGDTATPRNLVPRVGHRRGSCARHVPRARRQRADPERDRLCARVQARDGSAGARTGSRSRRCGRSTDYTGRLRRILQRIAPRQWEADIVVLTPGSFNAAYYEHRLLADRDGRDPRGRTRAHRGRGRGLPPGRGRRRAPRGCHLLAREQRMARSSRLPHGFHARSARDDRGLAARQRRHRQCAGDRRRGRQDSSIRMSRR